LNHVHQLVVAVHPRHLGALGVEGTFIPAGREVVVRPAGVIGKQVARRVVGVAALHAGSGSFFEARAVQADVPGKCMHRNVAGEPAAAIGVVNAQRLLQGFGVAVRVRVLLALFRRVGGEESFRVVGVPAREPPLVRVRRFAADNGGVGLGQVARAS
jgi:hypothetical protein